MAFVTLKKSFIFSLLLSYLVALLCGEYYYSFTIKYLEHSVTQVHMLTMLNGLVAPLAMQKPADGLYAGASLSFTASLPISVKDRCVGGLSHSSPGSGTEREKRSIKCQLPSEFLSTMETLCLLIRKCQK